MKVLERGFEDYDQYRVVTSEGFASVNMGECPVSCGIKEIESVGAFIDTLSDFGFKPREIANELKIMANKANKFEDDKGAFVMLSLAAPNRLYKTVCSHLKKDGATITRWRTNPNSKNKINVVIM